MTAIPWSNNTMSGNTIYAGTISASSTSTNISVGWPTGSGTTYVVDYGDTVGWSARDALDVMDGKVTVPKRALSLQLPDGAILEVDEQGNYKLADAAAQVIYQANRMREFNPYVNASDLIARFIGYLGTLGIKRGEVATLPLGLLVNWLIVEAAEKDGDPLPVDVVPVPANKLLRGRTRPRCLACQRFARRALVSAGIAYCRPICAERHTRTALAKMR